MSRAPWVVHFGLAATPFGKRVAAADLLARPSHDEAVARIRFCVAESLAGVIVGEVSVGKTVALRAALHGPMRRRTRSSTWPTRPSAPVACM